ncbi:MAG TPA: hypothetical protein PLZ79_00560 [Burkholderiales bacterium]|nr:hypothetical protein [Burkholderiales bacterium]
MTRQLGAIPLLCLTSTLLGCATNQSLPLLFGQTQTVGITINAAPQEQSAELTLGYRDRDIAIVPVSVPQPDGSNTQLSSTVPHETLAGAEAKDAFSVLGQFEVDSNARQVEAGLGKFFATGLAAQKLADGFACKLGKNCSESPPAK